MSANNYIKIYKNEYDLYEVDVCDAETGIFTVSVGRRKRRRRVSGRNKTNTGYTI